LDVGAGRLIVAEADDDAALLDELERLQLAKFVIAEQAQLPDRARRELRELLPWHFD
jgi:hypothetical protein